MLWGVLVQRFLCKHCTLDGEPRNTIAQDAGSIPAASTQTGCTTRLERKKARQYQLAGLGRFVHVDRDLRDIDHTRGEQIAGLTLAQLGPKNLELAQESRNHVTHPK